MICAEAGLSLDASLTRVSRELEPTWPEISEEFGITAAELTFLPERRQAFENLNGRTNLGSIRGVVNTLLQTAKFGTPLAQSLRVLAAEYREARITRAEEKAARLPAMLTVPMILFILPTLFIVLLGPAALNIVDTFSGKKQSQTTTVKSNGAGSASSSGATTVVDKSKPGSSSGESSSSAGSTVIIESNDSTASEPDASLVLEKNALRIIDPVVVDIDARKLRTGYQHRLAIVPADTPDKVTDAAAFARDSFPVEASRMRVYAAAHSAGKNEVRLYYIPHFGNALVVAARANIDVTGGSPGATQASQLIRDAGTLGAAAFASNYRDRGSDHRGPIRAQRAAHRRRARFLGAPARRDRSRQILRRDLPRLDPAAIHPWQRPRRGALPRAGRRSDTAGADEFAAQRRAFAGPRQPDRLGGAVEDLGSHPAILSGGAVAPAEARRICCDGASSV